MTSRSTRCGHRLVVISRGPRCRGDADFKRRARLNCISHLLSLVLYKEVVHAEIEPPPREEDPSSRRPPKESLNRIATPS